MKICFTRKAKRWFFKHQVNTQTLSQAIIHLCRKEGHTKHDMTIHISPGARDSYFEYYFNRLNVAVESPASKPRYYKLRKVCRNLLHELRHFIQYRIKKKPFALSYTYRDIQLINDRYWNDPDEVDARNYERKYLKFIYKKII